MNHITNSSALRIWYTVNSKSINERKSYCASLNLTNYYNFYIATGANPISEIKFAYYKKIVFICKTCIRLLALP